MSCLFGFFVWYRRRNWVRISTGGFGFWKKTAFFINSPYPCTVGPRLGSPMGLSMHVAPFGQCWAETGKMQTKFWGVYPRTCHLKPLHRFLGFQRFLAGEFHFFCLCQSFTSTSFNLSLSLSVQRPIEKFAAWFGLTFFSSQEPTENTVPFHFSFFCWSTMYFN